jgi:hypothetical protein
MTKAEKKEMVYNLIEDFKVSTDAVELKSLKDKIIDEVSQCPFSEEIKGMFELSLLSWGVDIDNYIIETGHGRASEDCNFMAVTSVVGIYSFIDRSLLED